MKRFKLEDLLGGLSWCGVWGYFGDSHTRYVLDLVGLAFLSL